MTVLASGMPSINSSVINPSDGHQHIMEVIGQCDEEPLIECTPWPRTVISYTTLQPTKVELHGRKRC